jgi:Serine dehydrogenase proteinase
MASTFETSSEPQNEKNPPPQQQPELRAPLTLPGQTPYFHALENERYSRQTQIRAIEAHTRRRLICFVSSPYAGITRDLIPIFGDLLEDIGERDDLDLLLNSLGGDIDAAEKLVIMCRAHCKGFRVIVPESAKSAATMMACAGDSIVMGYASELGPIDPQVSIPDAAGNLISRPAHSFLNGLEEIKRAAKAEGELSEATSLSSIASILRSSTTAVTRSIGPRSSPSSGWSDTSMQGTQNVRGRSPRHLAMSAAFTPTARRSTFMKPTTWV